MISATDVGQPSHWDSHHPGEGEKSYTGSQNTTLYPSVLLLYTTKGFFAPKILSKFEFFPTGQKGKHFSFAYVNIGN